MLLTWLEDFVAQFRYYIRYKIGISIGKKWHRRYKGATVVVYDILWKRSSVVSWYYSTHAINGLQANGAEELKHPHSRICGQIRHLKCLFI
jgi:hypothetical protein